MIEARGDWNHPVPSPIEDLITELEAAEPGVVVDRHWVSHDGDDDNLWFVRREADECRPPVQFECDASGLPILIESDNDRIVAASVAEACATIQRLLRDAIS